MASWKLPASAHFRVARPAAVEEKIEPLVVESEEVLLRFAPQVAATI